MSIVLGSLNTGSMLHGSIKAGAWEYGRSVQKWFGLEGEYHLLGQSHGRNLEAWVQLSGFASESALQSGFYAVNEFINSYGSLVVTIGGVTATYTNTVFNGAEMEEEPWLDASGINGWIVMTSYKFRQVKS